MKKIKYIYLMPIFLIFILIITIYLVYDYNHTTKKIQKQNKEEKNYENEYYKNELPQELKQNIPDKGDIIFIELFTDENKNKDILPLIKQENFRKSLYYALNRQEIIQNETNLKPLSVLFTKAFFQDNKKYFPKPFLPHNEDSMNIYQDLDLKNYGFNETKSLQYLEEAWNNLSSAEQNKDYVLRFAIDKDVTDINSSIKEKIITKINNLFQKFLKDKNLNSNKLKIEIYELKNEKLELNKLNMNISEQGAFDMSAFDMRLSVLPKNEEDYNLYFMRYILNFNLLPVMDQYNKEDCYLYFIRDIFNFTNNSQISINLSHIKQYLENQKDQGKIIENNLFKKLVQPQGILKCEINDFWDIFQNDIVILFPSLQSIKEGIRSQQEESPEIKELKQKTFEEIFEKILCLLHKQMLQISVCVHIIESKN